MEGVKIMSYGRYQGSTWPYNHRSGYPEIAQFTPWGYPTIEQSNAYRVYGLPPQPKVVNHAIHLIATVITAGFWIPVWLIVMIVTHNHNTRAEVQYWSNIQRYWQWELAQRSVIPAPRELSQGG